MALVIRVTKRGCTVLQYLSGMYEQAIIEPDKDTSTDK